MVRIYLDAMGGDNAPECTVNGAIEALRNDSDITITLAGIRSEIEKYLLNCDDVMPRIEIDECSEIITNDEAPVMAVRHKKDSAQVKGMLAVRDGKQDGFVSAGSTGATLAGGLFRLRCIEGIDRPALAPLLPNGKGYFCLIDCGANVDCLPEYLPQFAVMGSAYMKHMMGMENPRVGLVNIGAESEKGNALVKAVYPMMEAGPFNFVGNVEGRDITNDQADVIVCDGFSGNLILKFMEGLAITLLGMMKEELGSDIRGKFGYLMAKPNFRRFKKRMDYHEVGGAPLLGVNGAVVKAHGSSNAHAIACAIRQCKKMVDNKVVDAIREGVKGSMLEQ